MASNILSAYKGPIFANACTYSIIHKTCKLTYLFHNSYNSTIKIKSKFKVFPKKEFLMVMRNFGIQKLKRKFILNVISDFTWYILEIHNKLKKYYNELRIEVLKKLPQKYNFNNKKYRQYGKGFSLMVLQTIGKLTKNFKNKNTRKLVHFPAFTFYLILVNIKTKQFENVFLGMYETATKS